MDIQQFYYSLSNVSGDPVIMNDSVPHVLGKPDGFLTCITTSKESLVVPIWANEPQPNRNVSFEAVSKLLNDEHLDWAYRIDQYLYDGKIIDFDVYGHRASIHRVKVHTELDSVNVYARNRKIGVEWMGNLIKTIDPISYSDVWSD